MKKLQLSWLVMVFGVGMGLNTYAQALLSDIFVTNTNNSGPGSFQWALNQAFNDPSPNTIRFSLPSGAVIFPTSQLWMQGAGDNIEGNLAGGGGRVVFDGSNFEVDNWALVINCAGCVVRNLEMRNFPFTAMGAWQESNISFRQNILYGNYNGIQVESGAQNVIIEDNVIGVDENMGNNQSEDSEVYGIWIGEAYGVTISGNTISGLGTSEDNNVGIVLGSNGSGADISIFNNFIGLNSIGTQPIPNHYGIIVGQGKTNVNIYGNVIAGNTDSGVVIEGENVEVYDNVIGYDISGQNEIPSDTTGIWIGNGASGISIYRNQIAGNDISTWGIYCQNASNISIGTSNENDKNIIKGCNVGVGVLYNGVCDFGINELSCNIFPIWFQAQDGLPAPTITDATSNIVQGTAPVNAAIDVYIHSDSGCSNISCQGKEYVGSTQTNIQGSWSLSGLNLQPNTEVTAIATSGSSLSNYASCEAVSGAPTFCEGPSCSSMSCLLLPSATIQGQTDGSCSYGNMNDYGCQNDLLGPEYVYQFYMDAEQEVYFDLNSPSELYVMVMDECSANANCLDYFSSTEGGKVITIPEGGAYLVIDGTNIQGDTYTLSYNCDIQPPQPSSCDPAPAFTDFYQNDAEILAAVQMINDPAYSSTVEIPSDLFDFYYDRLNAIFNATGIPERDTVVECLNIHTESFYSGYSTTTVDIRVTPGTSWAQQLINGVFPTSNASVNNLMLLFGLTLESYYQPAGSNWRLNLQAEHHLNTRALANQFLNIAGVEDSFPSSFVFTGGSPGPTPLIVDSQNGYSDLKFQLGWDCFAGICAGVRSWVFRVFDDCSVQFLSSGGSILDPSIGCNLGFQCDTNPLCLPWLQQSPLGEQGIGYNEQEEVIILIDYATGGGFWYSFFDCSGQLLHECASNNINDPSVNCNTYYSSLAQDAVELLGPWDPLPDCGGGQFEECTHTFEWAQQFGESEFLRSNDIASDDEGNIYTVGFFKNTIDFDPGTGQTLLSSSGENDCFIQKMSSGGELIWAKSFGGSNWDDAHAIKIDQNGNIYVGGRFSQTADFDPGPNVANKISNGDFDAFILKLDHNGQFLWVRTFGGPSADAVKSLDIDNDNNVVIGGHFGSSFNAIDFDPGPDVFNIETSGYTDIFVSKFDSFGNFIWANSMGDGGYDALNAIAVDNQNNILIGGDACLNCSGPSGSRAYLAKINTFGVFDWTNDLDNTFNNSKINDLTTDENGNVYVTGEYKWTLDLDPGTEEYLLLQDDNNNFNSFVGKYNSNGTLVWGFPILGPGNEQGDAINIISHSVFITGKFSEEIDFDPSGGMLLTDPGIFVLEVNAGNGQFKSAKVFGDGSTNVYASAVNSAGNLITTGDFFYATDFDPDPSEFIIIPVGNHRDVFVQKLCLLTSSENPECPSLPDDILCLDWLKNRLYEEPQVEEVLFGQYDGQEVIVLGYSYCPPGVLCVVQGFSDVYTCDGVFVVTELVKATEVLGLTDISVIYTHDDPLPDCYICPVPASNILCEVWVQNYINTNYPCNAGQCATINLYTSPSGECVVDFVGEQTCLLTVCPSHEVFDLDGNLVASYGSACGLEDLGYTDRQQVWSCGEEACPGTLDCPGIDGILCLDWLSQTNLGEQGISYNEEEEVVILIDYATGGGFWFSFFDCSGQLMHECASNNINDPSVNCIAYYNGLVQNAVELLGSFEPLPNCTSPWSPQACASGNTHFINVIYESLESDIGGEPLAEGDWLGLFYEQDDGTLVCMDQAQFTDPAQENGFQLRGCEESSPGADDGFSADEPFQFKVFKDGVEYDAGTLSVAFWGEGEIIPPVFPDATSRFEGDGRQSAIRSIRDFPNIEDPSCDTPIPISCGQSHTGNNTDGTDNALSYNCFTNVVNGPEVIYTFTLDQTEDVLITLAGLSDDLELLLLDECDRDHCIAVSERTGASAETILYEDLSAGDYIVVVEGYIGFESDYTLSLDCGDFSQGGFNCTPEEIGCNETINSTTADGCSDVNFYGCADSYTPGREKVYRIRFDEPLNVRITLTPQGGDLDLFLLDALDPNRCIYSSTESGDEIERILLDDNEIIPNRDYYIVVDEYNEDTGVDFQLQVQCIPDGPPCPWCPPPPGFCTNAEEINCGTTISGHTQNGASRVDKWGDCPSFNVGPELIYTFNNPVTQDVQITLSGFTENLNFYVLRDQCAVSACYEGWAGNKSGLITESILITPMPAGEYYIVVDSYDAASAFLLEVKCQETDNCFELDVPAGYSFISSNRRPGDPTIENVLPSGQFQGMSFILSDEWGNIYDPNFPTPGAPNRIVDWAVTDGYRIDVSEGVTLEFCGEEADPEATRAVISQTAVGDVQNNLIAYPFQEPMTVEEAFAGSPTEGLASIEYRYPNGSQASESYIFSLQLGTNFTMQPGGGYLLKVAQDGDFSFRSNDGTSAFMPNGCTYFRTPLRNTMERAFIRVPNSAVSDVMQPGDELGLFNEEGLLCGSGKYLGAQFMITLLGDKAATTAQEGFAPDEVMYAQIWSAATGKTKAVGLQFNQSDAVYAHNQVYWLDGLTNTTYTQNRATLNWQLYPNPVRERLYLEYQLPAAQTLSVRLIGANGQVHARHEWYMDAGVNQASIDLRQLPSGIYFVQLATDGTTETKKIVVQR